MSGSLLAALSLLLVTSAAACKPIDGCEGNHCGECAAGDEPLDRSVFSPVSAGVDSAGVPVVSLVYNPAQSCFGEMEQALWMRWKAGAVELGPAEGALDTKKAKLVYLTDLQTRAFRWSALDLTMPFDEPRSAFTFSVIHGKEVVGTYRCEANKGVATCGPTP